MQGVLILVIQPSTVGAGLQQYLGHPGAAVGGRDVKRGGQLFVLAVVVTVCQARQVLHHSQVTAHGCVVQGLEGVVVRLNIRLIMEGSKNYGI